MAKKSLGKTVRKTRRRKKRSTKNNLLYRRIFSVALLAFLTITFLVATHTMREAKRRLIHTFEHPAFSRKYVVRGIDVSHHNAFIDWKRLNDENISFAYLKSTEGVSHKDRDYARNHKLAREAGLSTGSYHFYSFGVDGREQARHFIRNSCVLPRDMIPAIDVEHSPANKPASGKEELLRVVEELKALSDALFAHYGKPPVLYTNKECYKKYIEGRFPENPLWICDLRNEPSVASDTWAIWQFSHTGIIPGVANEVDLNYYRHSFADFQNLLMPQ